MSLRGHLLLYSHFTCQPPITYVIPLNPSDNFAKSVLLSVFHRWRTWQWGSFSPSVRGCLGGFWTRDIFTETSFSFHDTTYQPWNASEMYLECIIRKDFFKKWAVKTRKRKVKNYIWKGNKNTWKKFSCFPTGLSTGSLVKEVQGSSGRCSGATGIRCPYSVLSGPIYIRWSFLTDLLTNLCGNLFSSIHAFYL